jgi:hypothetical protein
MKHEQIPLFEHSPCPEQEYIDQQLSVDDAGDEKPLVDLYDVTAGVTVSMFVSFTDHDSVSSALEDVRSNAVCVDVPNAESCHESVTEPSAADDEDNALISYVTVAKDDVWRDSEEELTSDEVWPVAENEVRSSSGELASDEVQASGSSDVAVTEPSAAVDEDHA